MTYSPTYRWGRWRFEPAEWRLLRDGVVVALPAKTLHVLFTLLDRAPRLVTKSELLAEVWPDAAVEEGNIAFHVAALRKVLDEGEGASAIETVRGKGYRFVADLASPPPPPGPGTRAGSWVSDGETSPPPVVTPAPGLPPAPPHSAGRRRLVAGIALVLASGLAGLTWSSSRPDALSVDVRPFEIVSPSPGQETFPDGLRSYITQHLDLAGVAMDDAATASLRLSGLLQPRDDGFLVAIQLTRRDDNARVWDWRFEIPYDIEKPVGEDDARSRLQDAIARRTAEGVRSYLAGGAVPQAGRSREEQP